MKALVYHGPDDLRLEDRPEPEPGPGEAVLRVGACGICGTDLRIASGSHRAYPPGTVRVPGHEIAGSIVAAGDGADVPVGEPAFVAPNVGCVQCPQCRAGRVNLCESPQAVGITIDGAMAEYVLLPASLISQGNVLGAPHGLDSAAVAMVEPLACVLRGSHAVAIGVGDLVLINGAGPIGLLHLKVAKLRSPSAVIVSEPSAERREQARSWGADHVIDPITEDLPAFIANISGGRGADAIVVAAPSSLAQEQSLDLAAPGGRINFFGGLPSGRSHITIDSNPIHYKELIVTGTTANSTADCREALDIVASGAIDTLPLVSDRFPLEAGRDAFMAATSGKSLKVVLEP
jgi:L-iditol 2-dehydrogenase